jgi:dienelactone hydrolase
MKAKRLARWARLEMVKLSQLVLVFVKSTETIKLKHTCPIPVTSQPRELSCCKHDHSRKPSCKTIEHQNPFSIRLDINLTAISITDVFGHRFINPQLIADQLAANGYFVVMPDVFHGDPVPLNKPDGFDLMAWLKGPPGHNPRTVDPVIDATIVEMRTRLGCKRIGAVGYCFGAKYVIRHLRPDQGKIEVGYCAHPSFIESEELAEIKGPLAISAAETDTIFPAEKRYESEEILKKTGMPYQINLYSGVEHGFAVRGDLNDNVAKYAKESAFLQAVQFFGEYLKA